MRLGSLFDGIGGFPLAAVRCGIEPRWASEIEPFPVEVTKRHFPSMTHLGDVTKIDGRTIEPVEIITFGSPCTRLSIAGRHDGFDIAFACDCGYTARKKALDKYAYLYEEVCPRCGEVMLATNESALFFHAIRIIEEMRDATDGRYPAFAVWENVPGALSSNKGADFAAVISSFVEIGAMDVAWRVLDAKYFGVPQRRRRIFVVSDFAGERAGQVLFEPESMSRNTAESSKAREEVACTARTGSERTIDFGRAGDRIQLTTEVARTLQATNGGLGAATGLYRLPEFTPAIAAHTASAKADGHGVAVEASHTLDGATSQAVAQPIPFDTRQLTSPQNRSTCLPGSPCHTLHSGEPPSVAIPMTLDGQDIARTLTAGADSSPCVDRGPNVVGVPIGFNSQDGCAWVEGLAPTLRAQNSGAQNCVAFGPGGSQEVTHALRAAPSRADKPSSTTYIAVAQPIGEVVGALNASDPDKYWCNNQAVDSGMLIPVMQTFRMMAIGKYADDGLASTVKARDHKDATDLVCAVDCRNLTEVPVSTPLQSGSTSLNYRNPVRIGYRVRRLTPTECERLQGYPDGWTAGGSDTARYKALGNSVAVPVVEWIMRRLSLMAQ